ncbi:hypothetical protein ACFFX0_20710 [Citricoccus parietis]|uniref:Uncharacterized protein n=1 Tax=Citricoccus parietis TaxID=592307 RepID=A0ABV5G3H5_9MICC
MPPAGCGSRGRTAGPDPDPGPLRRGSPSSAPERSSGGPPGGRSAC